MKVERHREHAPRARPVADAPVAALLARADELARRWAVAQILARPLDQIAAVPLEDLARAAPSLCESLARALACDEELERIEQGDVPFAVAAWEPRALVGDIDALRSVLWDATLAALEEPSTRLLAELADRLASVCATLLATVLIGDGLERARAAPPAPAAPRQPHASRREHVRFGVSAAGGAAVLIDEFDEAPHALDADIEREGERGRSARATSDPRTAASEARAIGSDVDAQSRVQPRARPWDTPLDERASDEGPAMRVRRGPGLWLDADERRK
jgi:hypothetical protein